MGARNIDAAVLEAWGFDTRAPVWWGNLLLILIETVTVALLVMSYFYFSRNFTEWPPPQVEHSPTVYDPVPNLGWGSLNIVLVLASCVPMVWADLCARWRRTGAVKLGLSLAALLGAASIGVRILELRGLHFTWDDNAYGSIVWALLGMHLTYLLLAVVEAFVVIGWIIRHGLDENQAVDTTLTAVYWYWVAGTGMVIYATVYLAPRFM